MSSSSEIGAAPQNGSIVVQRSLGIKYACRAYVCLQEIHALSELGEQSWQAGSCDTQSTPSLTRVRAVSPGILALYVRAGNMRLLFWPRLLERTASRRPSKFICSTWLASSCSSNDHSPMKAPCSCRVYREATSVLQTSAFTDVNYGC